jgi:hypothetical protein
MTPYCSILSYWFCRYSVLFSSKHTFCVCFLLNVRFAGVIFGQKKSWLHQSKHQGAWSEGRIFYYSISSVQTFYTHLLKMAHINIVQSCYSIGTWDHATLLQFNSLYGRCIWEVDYFQHFSPITWASVLNILDSAIIYIIYLETFLPRPTLCGSFYALGLSFFFT